MCVCLCVCVCVHAAAADPYRDPYDVRGMHPWTSEDESVVSTWLQSTGAQELMSVVLVEPPAA